MKLMNKPVLLGLLALMFMAFAFGTDDLMGSTLCKALAVIFSLSSLKNLHPVGPEKRKGAHG